MRRHLSPFARSLQNVSQKGLLRKKKIISVGHDTQCETTFLGQIHMYLHNQLSPRVLTGIGI